jgi:hypothetical protein
LFENSSKRSEALAAAWTLSARVQRQHRSYLWEANSLELQIARLLRKSTHIAKLRKDIDRIHTVSETVIGLFGSAE